MPRKVRQKSKSRIYHIMIRGIERKKIFIDNYDRYKFLNILSNVKKEDKQNRNISIKGESSISNRQSNFSIYAYCLMPNHVHLIIDEGSDNLSIIMKRIGIAYVIYFNKKYDRVGHLFQDRFRSEAIETDEYLIAAVRYLHNNPVKANIVSHPSEYRWSSYNDYISTKAHDTFISRRVILEYFSDDFHRAIELFIDFSKKDDEREFMDLKEKGGLKSIIGLTAAQNFINNYIKERNISLNDLNNNANFEIRNDLIFDLKSKSNLTNVEIAHIFSLSGSKVQRILKARDFRN